MGDAGRIKDYEAQLELWMKRARTFETEITGLRGRMEALAAKLKRWSDGSDDNPQGCLYMSHFHDCPCGVYDEVADELLAALGKENG